MAKSQGSRVAGEKSVSATEQEKTKVVNADDMGMSVFIQHCHSRHPNVGFRSRGNHAEDHARNAADLDHVHS